MTICELQKYLCTSIIQISHLGGWSRRIPKFKASLGNLTTTCCKNKNVKRLDWRFTARASASCVWGPKYNLLLPKVNPKSSNLAPKQSLLAKKNGSMVINKFLHLKCVKKGLNYPHYNYINRDVPKKMLPIFCTCKQGLSVHKESKAHEAMWTHKPRSVLTALLQQHFPHALRLQNRPHPLARYRTHPMFPFSKTEVIFLFFFSLLLILFYVCFRCFACISVCHMHTWCPEARREHQIPWN